MRVVSVGACLLFFFFVAVCVNLCVSCAFYCFCSCCSERMLPSFFPPSAERAAVLKLERCMRVLPQDQDTGGFFMAVLIKTGPILWQVRRGYIGIF